MQRDTGNSIEHLRSRSEAAANARAQSVTRKSRPSAARSTAAEKRAPAVETAVVLAVLDGAIIADEGRRALALTEAVADAVGLTEVAILLLGIDVARHLLHAR